MDAKVCGGTALRGTVTISGSKNAVIPIICASLLAKGKVLLRNVPRISDVFDLCKILEAVECRIVFKSHTMLIDNTSLKYKPLLLEECSRIRGSYYLIGVFLSIFGRCEISLPGGCEIGNRPIDIHLKAFSDMGYFYEIKNNSLVIYRKKLKESTDIILKNKSVGASINALFASICLDSVIIRNVLFEPEGKDVIHFLTKIGYQIKLESECIAYKKSKIDYKLIKHTIIPDRIETMTYVVAGLLSGDVKVKNCMTKHLEEPLRILKEAEFSVEYTDNEIRAKKSFGKNMNIVTSTYPGFPTDLQAIFGVLGTKCDLCNIEETIFENRMQIYKDLKESNVECCLQDNKVSIRKSEVVTKNYKSYDLRHGIALILLSILCKKQIIIENFEYVLRGYDDVCSKFKALGYNIETILEKSS